MKGRGVMMAVLQTELNLGLVDIPPLPEVAAEVLKIANDPKSDAARLSRLVERDPALAATVVEIASSTAYGRSKARTLHQAIARLGMRQLTEIAVAASLRRSLCPPHARVIAREIWTHAVGTAAFARHIGAARRRSVETSFLSGLLHSIGKLVLLESLDPDDERDTEELLDVLDARHVELGRAAVEAWAMPDEVVVAITFFDAFAEGSTGPEAAATTWLAHRLAHLIVPARRPCAVPLQDDASLAALNLYPHELETLVMRTGDVRELTSVLS